MLGGNRVQEKPDTARAAADAVESLPDARPKAPGKASAAAPGIEGGREKRRVLRDG
jgi:hypothetical protein